MKQLSRLMLGGLALATSLGAPAFASGSMGGGANSTAQFGQSVYMRKVACKNCAFPGGIRNADQATMALAKIESGEIALSDREKRAVTEFINRRFRRG
jgi:hypothetical protein